MEDGLRGMPKTKFKRSMIAVLILVVMEDGLRVIKPIFEEYNIPCLNPCCNGRWSQRVPLFSVNL